MREQDIAAFAAAHADGGYVLDVREPWEYVSGHVPGAVPMPMNEIGARVGELPKDRLIHVVCASGNRSLVVTDALQRAGYQAVSVAGGTSGWRMAGHPVVGGPEPR